MRTLQQLRRNERGNVAVLFALVLPILLMASAFAVDEGSLYLERRQAQSVADLAAIAAATSPDKALATAFGMFQANGLIAGGLKLDDKSLQVRSHPPVAVVVGSYKAAPELSVTARFTPGGSPANAVRVTYRKAGTLFFARPFVAAPEISVTALATATPQVAFSVGSRLASLNGGVANALLDSLLGTSVALDVMSYNALLDAKIDLFDFLDAMNQKLSLSAVTYGDVLKASATRGAIAGALATVLNGTAKTAATTLSTSTSDGTLVALARILELGELSSLKLGGDPGYFAGVSALHVLNAAAVIAGKGKQIDLNVGANIPGLVTLKLSVAVGEPPQHAWYVVGHGGAVARTAQTRLKFVASLTGGALLQNGGVTLPIYAEVAYAEARVRSATCPAYNKQSGTAVIDVLPGVARIAIGKLSAGNFTDFSAFLSVDEATLLNVPLLLKIKGSASVVIGETSPILLNFSSEDVKQGNTKTATNRSLVDSLSKSLLNGLDPKVEILGIGLGSISAVKGALNALLAPLAPVLDKAIFGVLDAVGVGLGEADVQVHSVTCNRPVLVG